MKTVYQACDNEIFELREEATEHELQLFEAWLDALFAGHAHQTSLTDVVRHFKNSHHLMTLWERLKEALRVYWDDKLSLV